MGGGPFIHGISAPPDQIDEQVAAAFAEKDNEEAMVPSTATTTTAATTTTNYMDQPTEDEMEAANKGIRMAPVEVDAITPTNATKKSINVKKFRSKRGGKRRR
uniref:Uncharacterized protein n=1 Tax=Craspedostauros australis TaxID=1486917 RepID=A0A7R9ZK64_9STRA